MSKLAREALMHYLDASFKKTADTAECAILGDDIEEMSVELNPDTEQKKTILGKTKITDNGYAPSMSADLFYADPSSKLYPKLKSIALDRLKGEECKTLMLEVIVEDTSATKHLAYVQEVMVKPQSYGGDTTGVNIPFDVTDDGERTKGYVTAESLKAGAPVFAAGNIE